MKPFVSIIVINASLLLIAFLLNFAAFGNYDWSPVQLTFIAVANLLGAGFFFYDKRPRIGVPFLVTTLVLGALAGLLWKLYFDARMEMGAVDPEFMEAVWPIKRGY